MDPINGYDMKKIRKIDLHLTLCSVKRERESGRIVEELKQSENY
jgi:hypothetical protein